jgi:hypothetical protein
MYKLKLPLKSFMRFSVASHTTYPMSALTKYRAVLCMKVTGALRALSSTGIMPMGRFQITHDQRLFQSDHNQNSNRQ